MRDRTRQQLGIFIERPSQGFMRAFGATEAWQKVMARKSTPHAVALGLATGVFAAFVPIFGAQMLIAVAIAWAGRANVAAALLGTWAGNPLTWPAMWVASYLIGITLLREGAPMTVDELRWSIALLGQAVPDKAGGFAMLSSATAIVWPILKPLFVGGLVLGLISGGALYFIGRRAAEAFHIRRDQQA